KGVVCREAQTAQPEPVEQEVERLHPVELETVDGESSAGIHGLAQLDRGRVPAAGVHRVALLLAERVQRHTVLGEIRERDVLRLSLREAFDALAECGNTE